MNFQFLTSIAVFFRGYEDNNQCKGNVLGEEDAIWLLRLVLPYLNEFLLKIKALFSGDPATTMKVMTSLFSEMTAFHDAAV